ncbi:ECF transporter S component [Brevibacterium sp.]|uniref:ECF transporter S component n=1 Tax=Brevibacterium sp. TaxID=1701 RepID=UPI0025BB6F64|nr:ECF transporter S component [Brevibacterium sp.]
MPHDMNPSPSADGPDATGTSGRAPGAGRSTAPGSTHAAGNTPAPGTAPRRTGTRWRVVDIVVAAIIGVAAGVVFLAWSSSVYPVFSSWSSVAFPPALGLIAGMWVLAGPLGGLIIRKPGAALFCELLAATTEAALGSQFGPQILITGTLQGLGAELVFWWLRRRQARGARRLAAYTLTTALLAGLGSGIAMSVGDIVILYPAWAPMHQLTYAVLGWISATALAGGLSWLIYRAILPTGALSSFASGRDARPTRDAAA